MVGVLIRAKLAILRHSTTGTRASWMLTGALVGLALAVGTIAVGAMDVSAPGLHVDLLAVVFALWALGWMLGPAFGGEPVLRAEHLALLPISRVRLAVGLLAAAFVGITTAVTFVVFTAMVVYAARLGPIPVLVSIPVLVLELALVVLASRLTARLFGVLARSRTGAAITAVITAVLLVASQSFWLVFIALDTVLVTGFSPEFSGAVRALPSSWGLVAVEAAGSGDLGRTVGAVAGLAGVVSALLALWAALLGPSRLARPVVRGSAASGAAPPSWLGWVVQRGTAAVYVKELRSWLRDPQRVQSLVLAPAFAVLIALLPVLFGSTAIFPFAGALAVLMAAVASANLYGQDGTALWLTLVTPDTEAADVRGRQLGWLTIFGPLALAMTVAGALLHGDPALWPWALAATFALLGGGAGLLPLVALDQMVPGPDPQHAKNSPLEHGDVTGQSFVMLFLVAATALPALGVVLAGGLLAEPLLVWSGVLVGVLTGLLCYALLGRRAVGRLRTRGPELLYLMRAGKQHQPQAAAGVSVLESMPARRRLLLWTGLLVGAIALFPQALVPIGMKLSGNIAPVWFLALHLPEPWQWPTIAFMIVIGLGALGVAARIYFSAVRASKAGFQRQADIGPSLGESSGSYSQATPSLSRSSADR